MEQTPEAPSPRQSLADRMKSYESIYEFHLPGSTPTILRLDGHGFSKFTAHFARPFDQRIHDAMVSTCSDLLSHFPSATLAYTQSDEITLVFPSGIGSFNNRVQKIVSLAASFTSVRFNMHLSSAVLETAVPVVKEGVLGTAYFDGRLFSVPTLEEALNCVLWRCRHDAVRNSVGAFARTMFSTKELHGKSTQVVLEMMKEKGVVFREAVPKWAVEGSLVKKEQFEHQGRNEKTGETEITVRSRTRVVDRGVTEFSEENLKLVTEKYWNDCKGEEVSHVVK
jgi:tRNA(His) guanylyltransferase